MKKIVLMSLMVLVVLVSGCTSNNTVNQSSNVTLQINSVGSWNGTLAYNNGTQVINGSANANYNLGPSPGLVTVSLQKTGGNGTLTVELLQGGKMVQTQSTSANDGVVALSHNF
jgi:hypothetical protein